ncbi:MAG: efflux RND transporter periplasmic adaptor subunit [Hyphomicrobium sp.]
MTKPLKYLFTLGAPLAALGLAVVWMLNPAGSGDAARTYDAVTVGKGAIRKIVSTSGPVRALVTVSIGSQISGQVETIPVDFNSEVKAGDVLATIDSRTFEAKVAQSRADLNAAKAALTNQQAALTKAQAIKNVAERIQTRQKALQDKGYASSATLDAAQRDAEVATADIAVSEAMIESARAVIVQREAGLTQAEIDLDRTRIVAPINGTVISRTVDPGQTVAASLQAPELFKLAQDLRRIRIEAQVNEADVGAVSEGDTAMFTVDSYPDRTFQGKVTQVRLSATELANIVTYTVIIEASNDDRKLFPGMTANVQIEVAKLDNALRVPNDALRFKPRTPEASERGDGSGQNRSNRSERQISKLKTDLELSEEQERTVRDAIKKLFSENGSGPGQGDASADPSAMRQRLQTTIEQALGPLLTEEQRPLFEKWKRGRENVKSGAVYALDAAGKPERRFVRLGVSDDAFTEIAGGQLAEGDRVVLRVRNASK